MGNKLSILTKLAFAFSPESDEAAKPTPGEVLEKFQNPHPTISQPVQANRAQLAGIMGNVSLQNKNGVPEAQDNGDVGTDDPPDFSQLLTEVIQQEGERIEGLAEARQILKQILNENDGQIPTDLGEFMRQIQERISRDDNSDETDLLQNLEQTASLKKVFQRLQELGGIENIGDLEGDELENFLEDLNAAGTDIYLLLAGQNAEGKDLSTQEAREFFKNMREKGLFDRISKIIIPISKNKTEVVQHALLFLVMMFAFIAGKKVERKQNLIKKRKEY